MDCNDNLILLKGCYLGLIVLDIKMFFFLEEKCNESKCVKKVVGWKFFKLIYVNYFFLWKGGEFFSV